VREAHPTDEWQMKSNVKDDVCYAQPKNLEQRVAIANDFIKRYKYPVPFGIDDMTNAAEGAYSAWPERLYVIDEHGRISYKGGNGPFKYDPKEVRAWLVARYGEVEHEDANPANAKPAANGSANPASGDAAKPADTAPANMQPAAPASPAPKDAAPKS
jgi:iodothyronine deiodinase-like protein